MSTSPLTSVPDGIQAGATVKLRFSFADFPANDGWTLKFYMAGASVITPVAGAADGADFLVTLGPSVTAPVVAGRYSWEARASKAGDVYVASSGTLEVFADIATANAGDFQTYAERALAALRARLLGRVTDDQQRIQIYGRSIDRIPFEQLRAYESDLMARVRGERSGGKLRNVHTRFTPAGP